MYSRIYFCCNSIHTSAHDVCSSRCNSNNNTNQIINLKCYCNLFGCTKHYIIVCIILCSSFFNDTDKKRSTDRETEREKKIYWFVFGKERYSCILAVASSNLITLMVPKEHDRKTLHSYFHPIIRMMMI